MHLLLKLAHTPLTTLNRNELSETFTSAISNEMKESQNFNAAAAHVTSSLYVVKLNGIENRNSSIAFQSVYVNSRESHPRI